MPEPDLRELARLARLEDEARDRSFDVRCQHCHRPKREHKYAGDGEDYGQYICPDKVFRPIEQ